MRGRAALLLTAALVATTLGVSGLPAPAGGATTPGRSACRPARLVLCEGSGAPPGTVHLRVGQTVTVAAGNPTLSWSPVEVVGPTLLVRSGPARRAGSPESFRAVRPGRTTLTSTGTPRCAAGRPCPMFALLWRVAVVVAG